MIRGNRRDKFRIARRSWDRQGSPKPLLRVASGRSGSHPHAWYQKVTSYGLAVTAEVDDSGVTCQFLNFYNFEPFCPRPGFQKRLGQVCHINGRIVNFQNFAEFFAELCAIDSDRSSSLLSTPLITLILHASRLGFFF
jgi:hypothetical protein